MPLLMLNYLTDVFQRKLMVKTAGVGEMLRSTPSDSKNILTDELKCDYDVFKHFRRLLKFNNIP